MPEVRIITGFGQQRLYNYLCIKTLQNKPCPKSFHRSNRGRNLRRSHPEPAPSAQYRRRAAITLEEGGDYLSWKCFMKRSSST